MKSRIAATFITFVTVNPLLAAPPMITFDTDRPQSVHREIAPSQTTGDRSLTSEGKSQEQPSKKSRSVRIHNRITDDMTAYTILGVTYKADFKMKVNGQECGTNNTQMVILDGNALRIRYDYVFASGRKKGAKEVMFEVPDNVQDLDITFSWDNSWRVIVPQARPVKKIVVE